MWCQSVGLKRVKSKPERKSLLGNTASEKPAVGMSQMFLWSSVISHCHGSCLSSRRSFSVGMISRHYTTPEHTPANAVMFFMAADPWTIQSLNLFYVSFSEPITLKMGCGRKYFWSVIWAQPCFNSFTYGELSYKLVMHVRSSGKYETSKQL